MTFFVFLMKSKESTSIPNVERHVKAQTSESVLNIEPKTTQEINRSHSSETLPKNSHVKKKQQGDGSPSTVYNEHFPVKMTYYMCRLIIVHVHIQ